MAQLELGRSVCSAGAFWWESLCVAVFGARVQCFEADQAKLGSLFRANEPNARDLGGSTARNSCDILIPLLVSIEEYTRFGLFILLCLVALHVCCPQRYSIC